VKAYRQCVESVVGTFLVLMTNMRQAGWRPPPAADAEADADADASVPMPPFCCLLPAIAATFGACLCCHTRCFRGLPAVPAVHVARLCCSLALARLTPIFLHSSCPAAMHPWSSTAPTLQASSPCRCQAQVRWLAGWPACWFLMACFLFDSGHATAAADA
jgi:hypothetical protein